MKKISSLKCLILIGLLAFSLLPINIYADSDVFDSTNYTLVDYITPDGTGAYIDTGYNPRSNTSIDSTFSYTAITSGRRFYGANDSSNQYGLGISSNNYYVIRYSSGTSTKNTDGKFGVNTIVRFNQTPTITTATDGNTTYSTDTYTQSNNVSKSLVIFAVNTTGGVVNQYPTARLYNMEIYEGTTLVHHYYPCIRKSDSVVGVYDSIDNVFKTTSTGSLSYGSVATTQYTITTDVSPVGSGSVSGGGTYDSGSVIQLTATANSGYVFSSWSDGSTINPLSVSVSSNATYTAYFVQSSSPTTQYTITTDVSPVGSGSVSGGGTYDSGSVIQLTATANSGYVFSSWSDGSTINPRSVQVSSNATYTALFTSSSPTPTPTGIVVGYNANIIDMTYNRSVFTISGTESSNGVIELRVSGYDQTATMLIEMEIILNDDYVGSVSVSGHIQGTNVDTDFSRIVYVNGNHFKFTLGPYFNAYTFTISNMSYDVSGLSSVDTINDLIENGNQESQESVSAADQQNETFSDQASDLVAAESGLIDDFETSLNDVSPDFNMSDFGSNFLSSASWVRDQFDNIVDNTPFASLITFSLVLGVGLLIIGRVLK